MIRRGSTGTWAPWRWIVTCRERESARHCWRTSAAAWMRRTRPPFWRRTSAKTSRSMRSSALASTWKGECWTCQTGICLGRPRSRHPPGGERRLVAGVRSSALLAHEETQSTKDGQTDDAAAGDVHRLDFGLVRECVVLLHHPDARRVDSRIGLLHVGLVVFPFI